MRFPNGIPRAATTCDLRDRIAAVIQENLVWEAPNMSARLADAVIEALNLRTDQVGTLTRYVTEWIDNG